MKKFSRYCLAIIGIVCFSSFAYSQIPIFVNPDQAPSHLEWKEIQSEHYRVLYPKDLKEKAQRTLKQLEFYYPLLDRNFNQKFDKISVVLQTEDTVSNGYVALAPWRSHWITMPFLGDRLGATEWLETLAIHENRHMFQLASFKRGFSKFFYYLFGETGQAIAANWSTPAWVFEGDAVVEETLLSPSGRGRIPSFLNFYRAQLIQDKIYDYDKAFLGSYKDYVPDHYSLGFVLNIELRRKMRPEIAGESFKASASSAWNPFAYENAIYDLKGVRFSEFYQNAFKHLKNHFLKRDQEITPTPYKEISPSSDLYQNDSLMGVYQNKFLIFQTGLVRADRFALYNPAKNEYEHLFRVNGYLGNKVTIVEDKFVYQDLKIHSRFLNENYSDLFLYDLKANKRTRLTFKKRYFLPELSPEGDTIIALSFDKSFTPILSLISLDGKVIAKAPLKKNIVPISLNFDDRTQISMIYRDDSANFYLANFDLATQEQTILFSTNAGTMDTLRFYNDQYWFKANFDGQDNIYQYDTKARKLIKATEARFGAYYPLIHDDFLFYNNYNLKGRKIVRSTMVHNKKQLNNKYYIDKVLRDEKLAQKAIFKESPIAEYKEKNINRDYFNIHSWEYLSSLLSPYQSLTLQSNDILNEFNTTTGFLYHNGEKSMTYFLGLDYQRFWPIIHLRGDIGKRTIFTNYGQDNEEVFSWHQNSFNLGFSLPYQTLFSGNTLTSSITFLKGYRYISHKNYPSDEQNGELNTNQVSFNLNLHGEQSLRDIKPRWGIDLIANQEESYTVIGDTPNANLKNYGAIVYLPGIWTHHHLFFSHSFQEKTTGSYDIQDQVLLSRGYQDEVFKEKYKYTANYSLPLLYPDFALGRFIYFKRIRTNLFYDYAYNEFDNHFRSYGAEIIFDTHFVRNLFINLSWGIRSSILLDDPENDINHEVFLETALANF